MNEQMINDIIAGILKALGGNVTRIVLYGSTARGTNTPESDIDIAVFVLARLDANADDRLSDAVVDLNLKHDKVFSVVDIDEGVYEKWKNVTPFYQNVDREGVVLWKAA